MQINNIGHLINSKGKTTNPTTSTYFAGTSNIRIAFDVCDLDDGKVAIHSMYGNINAQVAEDFLYEVVEREDALECLITMIDDAHNFLLENTEEDVESTLHFLIEDFRIRVIH